MICQYIRYPISKNKRVKKIRKKTTTETNRERDRGGEIKLRKDSRNVIEMKQKPKQK